MKTDVEIQEDLKEYRACVKEYNERYRFETPTYRMKSFKEIFVHSIRNPRKNVHFYLKSRTFEFRDYIYWINFINLILVKYFWTVLI